MTTVLVTGANRGIGLEFTTQYLARGYRVIATCRDLTQAQPLKALRAGIADLMMVELDASRGESIAALPHALKGEAIDIFINNAGVYGPRDSYFGKVQAQPWLDVFQVNTIAPLLLTQALMENLADGKDRKLVYLTSKMGSIAENGGGGHYVYRSSKTALNSVVKSLAVDLAEQGFVAAVLHPGWVQTDMGGPNALIDTRTSVSGMLKVIDGLAAEQPGGFFNYDGSALPW
jgi:NAD(P)-dependent dehydrogenase (short-subunit alcohol dehydrogenase family)